MNKKDILKKGIHIELKDYKIKKGSFYRGDPRGYGFSLYINNGEDIINLNTNDKENAWSNLMTILNNCLIIDINDKSYYLFKTKKILINVDNFQYKNYFINEFNFNYHLKKLKINPQKLILIKNIYDNDLNEDLINECKEDFYHEIEHGDNEDLEDMEEKINDNFEYHIKFNFYDQLKDWTIKELKEFKE